MKWLNGVMSLLVFGLVSTGFAQLTDDAANYGGVNPAWETGSNEGAGFGPWTLNAGDPGGHFLGGSDGNGGRTNLIDTAGQAFGMWHEGGPATEAIRGFDTDVWHDTSVLSFDVSFRFVGGSRGVTLSSAFGEIFYFTIDADGYAFPGGDAPETEWDDERQFGEILTFTFTQNGEDLDWSVTGIHATSPDVGGTIENATLETFRIFNAAGTGGDDQDFYFNNLSVTQGVIPPLRFTDGMASPDALGEYSYELERQDNDGEAVIHLSSSNTDVLTVPASVTFDDGIQIIEFDATIVSLFDGPATILASNTVDGTTAEFVVTPTPAVLSIDGPFQLFETAVAIPYTLNRSGPVTDDIVFSSSDEAVLTVPASQSFDPSEPQLTFDVAVVGFGSATIYASNIASGAVADYFITVTEPSLTLSGQSSVRQGLMRTYTLTRVGPIPDLVYLESSDGSVFFVPATVEFGAEDSVVTFDGDALMTGNVLISATNSAIAATPLQVTVYATPAGVYDEGSFYSEVWADESNGGNGFGPWSFNHQADSEADPAYFAGVFIGDPIFAGITGMDAESFGFFANPVGSPANAEVSRSLTDALTPGDTFMFQLGLNWVSFDENSNRGFNLFAGATQLLNINMGNSDTITVNGEPMFTNYGTQAMLIHIQYFGNGQLRVWGTGRDGVETFDEVINVGSSDAPDNFAFYFNATTGDAQRQMYVNNLQVMEGAPPLLIGAPTITPAVDGVDVSFNLGVGSAGVEYRLEFTTDLTAEPQVWTEVEAVVGNGVDDVVLTDEDTDDPLRIYRLVVIE